MSLNVLIQNILPHKLLSAIAHSLANTKVVFIKNILISYFISNYPINLQEAKIQDIKEFESFNHFFTRELLPNARLIENATMVSPADGEIAAYGKIQNNTLLQAKGREYSLSSLLGSEELSKDFSNHNYLTVYLAPTDYHRVHMPIDGTLIHERFIPGKLFSVNTKTTNSINNIFSRNERLVTIFETPHGKVAVILVGAMIVGSIETVWNGISSPPHHKSIQERSYTNNAVNLNKGAELGLFKLGSTVIILSPNKLGEFTLKSGSKVKYGQAITK